jgi:hypothetical protein
MVRTLPRQMVFFFFMVQPFRKPCSARAHTWYRICGEQIGLERTARFGIVLPFPFPVMPDRERHS